MYNDPVYDYVVGTHLVRYKQVNFGGFVTWWVWGFEHEKPSWKLGVCLHPWKRRSMEPEKWWNPKRETKKTQDIQSYLLRFGVLMCLDAMFWGSKYQTSRRCWMSKDTFLLGVCLFSGALAVSCREVVGGFNPQQTATPESWRCLVFKISFTDFISGWFSGFILSFKGAFVSLKGWIDISVIRPLKELEKKVYSIPWHPGCFRTDFSFRGLFLL